MSMNTMGIIGLLVAFACVFLLMFICKAVSNAIDIAKERKKKEKDMENGAFIQTKSENLSDRFNNK